MTLFTPWRFDAETFVTNNTVVMPTRLARSSIHAHGFEQRSAILAWPRIRCCRDSRNPRNLACSRLNRQVARLAQTNQVLQRIPVFTFWERPRRLLMMDRQAFTNKYMTPRTTARLRLDDNQAYLLPITTPISLWAANPKGRVITRLELVTKGIATGGRAVVPSKTFLGIQTPGFRSNARLQYLQTN